jgi:hypothetical protein
MDMRSAVFYRNISPPSSVSKQAKARKELEAGSKLCLFIEPDDEYFMLLRNIS